MKTIVKNGVYSRVENSEADIKVRSGWKLCPKSEWKINDRDLNKKEKVDKKSSEKN